MDYLFSIGLGSRHANMELRWALRSLEKFGRNVGRVVVAGSPPDWLSGEVVRVPVVDVYPMKHKNIAAVLEGVLDAGVLDGEFVLASDDVFYVERFDADNHPYWMKERELPTEIPKGEELFRGYWNNLIAARRFMEERGLPTINFSTHANMRGSVDSLEKGRRTLRESVGTERGVDAWVLVGGLYKAFTDGVEPVVRSDVKLRKAESVEDVERQVSGRDCFSIADTAFESPAFLKYMQLNYPRKCRWEA